MDFSVVIPAYNDQDSISGAVRSALDQSMLSEVIVVDDGSTDDTARRAAEIGDPRIRVVSQTNAGPGAARNRGAEVAIGSHVVFLDSDDHLLPDALLTFATGNESADLIRSGAVVQDEATRKIVLARSTPFDFPRGAPLAGSFAIRRTLFESIGGYDLAFRFGENSEMLLRAQAALSARGVKPTFVGAATVVWEHDTGGVRNRYRPLRLAATEQMLAKHRKLLANDHETWHNHCAIAAEMLRAQGNRRRALHYGLMALRVAPTSPRAWARVARILVGRRPTPSPTAPH